jgi:hypothetical protein
MELHHRGWTVYVLHAVHLRQELFAAGEGPHAAIGLWLEGRLRALPGCVFGFRHSREGGMLASEIPLELRGAMMLTRSAFSGVVSSADGPREFRYSKY